MNDFKVSTKYRVKCFVKHPWHTDEFYTYFESKEEADAFLAKKRTKQPEFYVYAPQRREVETVGIVSNDTHVYCLGEPIKITT